jgi:signal peptidase I
MTAQRDPGRGESFAAAAYSWLREAVIVVVLALVLSLIVKTWLLQAFYIPSASMENTLLKGDRVVVSKLTPGPFDLQRGDVIVFADPDHWLAPVVPPERGLVGRLGHDLLTFVGLLPNDEGNHLIKRIVGLPGDKVVCCTRGGLLTVNGKAITEEYIKPGDAPSEMHFSITVPAGKLWVMGDNRSDSGDSRYHDDGTGRSGSVDESLVVGRAMTVVWPLHDVAWLGRGGSTFADVPAHPARAAGRARSTAKPVVRHSSKKPTRPAAKASTSTKGSG